MRQKNEYIKTTTDTPTAPFGIPVPIEGEGENHLVAGFVWGEPQSIYCLPFLFNAGASDILFSLFKLTTQRPDDKNRGERTKKAKDGIASMVYGPLQVHALGIASPKDHVQVGVP